MIRLGKALAVVAGAACVAVLSGCQEDQRPAVTLAEARQVAATFSQAEPVALPPRTISDITAVLDQYKPDPAVAAELRAKADAPVPARGSVRGEERAAMLFERGGARAEVGRTEEAIADFELAVLIREQIKSPALPRTLSELAKTQLSAGRPLESLRTRERTIDYFRSSGLSRHGQLISTYGLAAARRAANGDLAGAEADLARAEEAAALPRQRARDPILDDLNKLSVDVARGEIMFVRGDYTGAEKAYRDLIAGGASLQARYDDIRRLVPNPPTEESFVRYQTNGALKLAKALIRQARFIDAEIEARRGLLLALRTYGKYNSETALLVTVLSAVLQDQGRIVEARRLAEVAVDILEKGGHVGSSERLASARREVATSAALDGDGTRALAMFDALATDLANHPAVRDSVLGEVLVYPQELMRARRFDEAEALVRRLADDRTRKLGANNRRTAVAQGHLAAVLAARGDRAGALALYRDAVPVILSASRAAADDQGTAREERARAFVLEHYLALLSEIGGTELEGAVPDLPGEAFRVADAIRGTTVQKALAASAARAAASDPDLARLVREEQDAASRVAALQGLLADALTLPPDQQDGKALETLRADIDRLRDVRAALRGETERRFPDYIDLIDPRPATLAEARRTLRPGEALVATYVAEDRTYVWAMRVDSPVAFRAAPLGRTAVRAAVAELRRSLDPNAATLGDIPAFDTRLAHRLYAALLEPVSAGWKGSRDLLVVPHDALGQLPFSVLATAARDAEPDVEGKALFAGYRTVPFLVRELAVTQLPSVSSLAALRRLPPGDPKRRAFAGFGDPWFNAEQAAEAAAEQQKGSTQVAMRGGRGLVAMRGVPLRRRSAPATQGVDSAELGLLPRLPDTAAEVRGVAAALGADATVDVRLGRDANEQAIRTMDLANRRVVMFATHGLVPGDLNGLTQPALALSAPAVAGVDGDGLLTLDEVVGLHLNADWVVLSACNTASGDGAGAEAVSGLGRAFFFAGTRALLVTNWPVETTSARALTTDVFRRQAADPGLARSEALRRSMAALIDGPGYVDPGSGATVFSYAHPIFWAPFTLVGDGGGTPGA